MSDMYDKKANYYNLLNRIQKRNLAYEGLLLVKKLYLTDNIFFYLLCVFFRFINLISLSGDYSFSINNKNTSKSIQNYLKKFTIFNLFKYYNFSYKIYILILLLILIIFFIQLYLIFDIYKNMKNFNYTNKWPLPSKLLIINDHLIFLLFPYILEYLSFSYYIYLFPDKFIIKLNGEII